MPLRTMSLSTLNICPVPRINLSVAFGINQNQVIRVNTKLESTLVMNLKMAGNWPMDLFPIPSMGHVALIADTGLPVSAWPDMSNPFPATINQHLMGDRTASNSFLLHSGTYTLSLLLSQVIN